MTDVQTRHYNDDDRVQHTERIVTIEDATGEEFEHVFELTEDGHEYAEEGDPPESAVEAIEAFEEEHSDD